MSSALVLEDVPLESLYGGCVMCEFLMWAREGGHVCPHKYFEASKRVDYLEECKREWKDNVAAVARYTRLIEALQKRTPEQKEKDDYIIAKTRAAIAAVRDASCRCTGCDSSCVCGSKERIAALPPTRQWPDFRHL